MITKECYLRKLEITRGFNAPCIVLIIGKVLIKESLNEGVAYRIYLDDQKVGGAILSINGNRG